MTTAVVFFLMMVLSLPTGGLQDSAGETSGPPLAEYVSRQWTDADGLPLNGVNTLLQTRDGFLWVGTVEGLARFDGRQFTVFDTSNTPALGNNMVWSLHEGGDGSLWAGTWGGLARLKDGRWTAYTTEEGLWHNTVRALDEDAHGTLWIGTARGLNALSAAGDLSAVEAAGGVRLSGIRALRADGDGGGVGRH